MVSNTSGEAGGDFSNKLSQQVFRLMYRNIAIILRLLSASPERQITGSSLCFAAI